ncbi:MAG TPA: helix-turn-helix domain-containing protein [Xanthomonadales bacterium]|nr:helix-turn-helix domain-containing protein [Xanthomonadales bacterium]
MDISEVANQSGLPASTLRYYEEIGLVRSVGRKGLKRLFENQVLERLALISLGQAAGFSLDEIRRMIGLDGQPQIDRALLMRKAEQLDASIKQLTRMRDGLQHAAVCSAPSHMECPTFKRLLGLASAGVIGRDGKRDSQEAPKKM